MPTSRVSQEASPRHTSSAVKKKLLGSAWHNDTLGELVENRAAIVEASFGADRAEFYRREARESLADLLRLVKDDIDSLSSRWTRQVKEDDATKVPPVQAAIEALRLRIKSASKKTYDLPPLPPEITAQQVVAPIRKTLDGLGRVLPVPVTKDHFDFAMTVRLAAGARYRCDVHKLASDFGAQTRWILREKKDRVKRLLEEVNRLTGTPRLEVKFKDAPFYFVLVPPTFTLGQTLTRLNELNDAKAQENAPVRRRDDYRRFTDLNLDVHRWRVVLVAEDEKQLTAAKLSGYSTLNAACFRSGVVPRIEMPTPADGPLHDDDDELAWDGDDD